MLFVTQLKITTYDSLPSGIELPFNICLNNHKLYTDTKKKIKETKSKLP